MATINKTVARWKDNAGIRKRVVVEITPGAGVSSEVVTPSDVGLGQIEYWPPMQLTSTDGTVIAFANYIVSNSSLRYYNSVGASSAIGANFAGRVEVIGK